MKKIEYIQKVISRVKEDVVILDDGYSYYWPKNKGALSSTTLKIIAAYLEQLNKPLEDQIAKDLNDG